MTTTVTATAAELGMYDDLRRTRQDELPISQDVRRPSFLPGNRNGVTHISAAVRGMLQNAWSTRIEDSETEKTKGLAMDDPRPWARAQAVTQNFIQNHRAEAGMPTAPNRSHNGQNGSNAKQQQQNNRSAIDGGPSAAPGLMMLRDSPQSQNLVAISTNGAHQSATRQEVQGKTGPDPVASSQNGTSQSPTTPRSPQSSPRDMCLIWPVIPAGEQRMVCYRMGLEQPGPRPILRLKEISFNMAIDLGNFQEPSMEGAWCVLVSPDKMTKYAFALDQCQRLTTEEFCEKLKQGQSHVAHQRSQSVVEVATPQEPSPAIVSSVTAGSVPPTASTQGTNTSVTQVGSTDPTPTPSLIDEDDGPVDGPVMDTTEKDINVVQAVTSLMNLVKKILPAFAAEGLTVDEPTLETALQTILHSWLDQGFLKSKPREERDQYLEAFRILVRLELKALIPQVTNPPPRPATQPGPQPEQTSFQQRQQTPEPIDVDSDSEWTPRPVKIKYSRQQLLQLRSLAISPGATRFMEKSLISLQLRSGSSAAPVASPIPQVQAPTLNLAPVEAAPVQSPVPSTTPEPKSPDKGQRTFEFLMSGGRAPKRVMVVEEAADQQQTPVESTPPVLQVASPAQMNLPTRPAQQVPTKGLASSRWAKPGQNENEPPMSPAAMSSAHFGGSQHPELSTAPQKTQFWKPTAAPYSMISSVAPMMAPFSAPTTTPASRAPSVSASVTSKVSQNKHRGLSSSRFARKA